MFSPLHPITKKTMILSKKPLKYDVDMRLLESTVNWVKSIDFSLCAVALYVKDFGPYLNILEFLTVCAKVLKASLLCKSVTNFYVLL